MVPECNLPHIAQALRDSVRDDYGENYLFMMEDSSDRKQGAIRDMPGSLTSERNKRESAEMLRDLYLKPGLCRLHRPFISTNSAVAVQQDIESLVLGHLANYKLRRILRRDHAGAEVNEIYFTGKLTGDRNDDFVSALLIAVWNKREFFRDPDGKYAAYNRRGEQ